MSMLQSVKKSLAVAPPVLLGADLGTRAGEFWSFNGPGGFDYKFSYTGHESSLKAFEKCPPLHAILLKKAQAFTNGKTWIVNKKGKARDKESTSEVANKIRALMANPNPFQSQKEFEAQQYIYTQLFGWCLVLPIKPVGFANYEATKLWNIPPFMIDVEETKKSWLLAQTQRDMIPKIVINFGDERKDISAFDVFIIKDATPSMHSAVFPESRVKANEMPINNIIGAYESRNVLINYRGALGMISSDSKDSGGYLPMKEDEKEALQNDFRRYGLTKQQWQFIITTASVKWTQMGIPTKDLMLFEEIEDDIMRLCDGWGYQYELMSSVKGVTFANKKEAKTLLYVDTTVPEAESIAEQWNTLFGLTNLDIQIIKDFSHVPALQEDQQKMAATSKTRNEALLIEFMNNQITFNEWRTANDRDPVVGEFGDKRYFELVQLGWKFGTQSASAQNPQQNDPNQQQQDTNQQQNDTNNQQ